MKTPNLAIDANPRIPQPGTSPDFSAPARLALGATAAVELGIADVWVDVMASIPEADLAKPAGLLGALATGYLTYRSAKAGFRNAGIAITGEAPSKK